jgi:hypothetical protein
MTHHLCHTKKYISHREKNTPSHSPTSTTNKIFIEQFAPYLSQNTERQTKLACTISHPALSYIVGVTLAVTLRIYPVKITEHQTKLACAMTHQAHSYIGVTLAVTLGRGLGRCAACRHSRSPSAYSSGVPNPYNTQNNTEQFARFPNKITEHGASHKSTIPYEQTRFQPSHEMDEIVRPGHSPGSHNLIHFIFRRS